MGDGAAGGVDVRLRGESLGSRPADGRDPDLAWVAHNGTGTGGRSSQPTMLGMVETSTGGLDVTLPPMSVGALMVVHHGVQAGQAGACGEKHRQKQERLDPKGPVGLSPAANAHGSSIPI